MTTTVECEFCRRQVARTTGNQRTCLEPSCKRKLRSRTRKDRYYEARQTPLCVWCDKPIHEKRKRKYHAVCKREQSRERVADYYYENKARLEDPTRARKPRNYKQRVTCMFCKRKVPRTSARQVICKELQCRRALKNLRKRENRVEKLEIMQRIEASRAARIAKHRTLEETEVYGAHSA